jgi:aryl-alcohol dehydrogenase-like predicted oxidoreductase
MRLGFGCVNLGRAGGDHSARADVRLVHAAIDAGVRVFDTAGAYGSGSSERVLGRALQGRRDEVVLATKGGYVFRERPPLEQTARRLAGRAVRTARAVLPSRAGGGGGSVGGGSSSTQYQDRDDSPGHLRSAVEASLRRLRTDHIDVYQLHGPTEVHPTLFDELHDLVAAGKVGRFGIGAESVGAALEWLAVPAVETVQIPFGILDPQAATELLARLDERPVEVWIRGVLGGGLLGLAGRDPVAAARDPKGPTIDRLVTLAARSGFGLDALAVGFVRSFAGVSTMLVGISSSAHLERNVALHGAPPLPDDVLAELLTIAATGEVTGG